MTMRFTAVWYEAFYEQKAEGMYAVTQGQIDEYCRQAARLQLPWSSDEIRY